MAYKTYQNCLKVNSVVQEFKNSIIDFYCELASEGENELNWTSQLLKVELENKNKEKYNQRKYEWKSL